MDIERDYVLPPVRSKPNATAEITQTIKYYFETHNYTYDPIDKIWYQYVISPGNRELYVIDTDTIILKHIELIYTKYVPTVTKRALETKVWYIYGVLIQALELQIPYWLLTRVSLTTVEKPITLEEVIMACYYSIARYTSSTGITRNRNVYPYIRDILTSMGCSLLRGPSGDRRKYRNILVNVKLDLQEGDENGKE